MDDLGYSSDVRDGEALTPVGAEGSSFAGRAMEGARDLVEEVKARVRHTPAVLDAEGHDGGVSLE